MKDQSEIKSLISKGLAQGYLTHADLIDGLPPEYVDPERIEDIIRLLNERGIVVYEDEAQGPDTENLLLTETPPTESVDEDAAEEVVAALMAAESELGRTTDPVRMYMREMGTVELLTRQGEIAIAQRIEEGIKHVLVALAHFPKIIDSILNEYAKVTRDIAAGPTGR